MKVEKHAEIEKKLIEREVIRFSKDEIEKIILEKVSAGGFDVNGAIVIFNTKYRYIEDEWGMNRYLTSEFIDIQVNL